MQTGTRHVLGTLLCLKGEAYGLMWVADRRIELKRGRPGCEGCTIGVAWVDGRGGACESGACECGLPSQGLHTQGQCDATLSCSLC